MNRDTLFSDLAKQAFDLIVIGGGINGVAIARDAALRGLKVVLFEQRDFGCGASSKTSKLAHGGLRYLETRQFRLVKECLQERSLLLDHAFPFVRPLPFLFPVYKNRGRPLWQIKTGIFLYELLDRYRKTPKHQNFSPSQIQQMFPHLTLSSLKGGCLYYDAIMEDSRLLMANLQDAQQAGALAFNDASVMGLLKEKGNVIGVEICDQLSGKSSCAYAPLVINVTGAWSDTILEMDEKKHMNTVAPTKGVHLVIPQVHPEVALTLLAPQDQRVFFLIPWNGETLLGTTDTPYTGSPDSVAVTSEDVAYLLEAYCAYFPERPLEKGAVIAAYAGLRPLVRFDENASPSERSRDYILRHSPSGLLTILGGKYTSHRFVAQEAVNQVVALLGKKEEKSPTFSRSFHEKISSLGMGALSQEILEFSRKENLTFQQMDHLMKAYGSGVQEILKRISIHPEEKKQICSYHPHLYAELFHVLQQEQVHYLEDWFCRRTSIAYTRCQGLCCEEATAEAFARHFGWDSKKKEEERKRWKKFTAKNGIP